MTSKFAYYATESGAKEHAGIHNVVKVPSQMKLTLFDNQQQAVQMYEISLNDPEVLDKDESILCRYLQHAFPPSTH